MSNAIDLCGACTLAVARQDYLRHLSVSRDLSEHTLRAYAGDLKALEVHLGPGFLTRELRQANVFDFLDVQREGGRSSATLRRRAATMRGFCSWLTREGRTETYPFPSGPIAAGRARRLPKTIPSDDLHRLIRLLVAEAKLTDESPTPPLPRAREATTLLAATLMTSTGARVQEVVSLRSGDVNIAERTLLILGKGRRERQVYLVDDWMTALTHSYLVTREQIGVEHDRLLFNTSRQPLSTASVRSRLASASRRAGLSRSPTPHMFRHTAATRLMEADVDIRFIQRLLGHASLTTTEIYTHVTDAALQRAVTRADVLSGFCGGDN